MLLLQLLNQARMTSCQQFSMRNNKDKGDDVVYQPDITATLLVSMNFTRYFISDAMLSAVANA